MKCKEITAKMDLRQRPKGGWESLAYSYHLLICVACRRYLNLTNILRQAFRSAVDEELRTYPIQRFNDELLSKFKLRK